MEGNISVRSVATSVVAGLLGALTLIWLNPFGWGSVGELLTPSATWGSCEVSVVITADRLPEDAATQVKAAADNIGAASGLSVHYDGTVDAGPAPRAGQVLIRWAPQSPSGTVDAYGETHRVVRRGAVGAATVDVSSAPIMSADPGLLRYTVEHELGHVLGLAHSADEGSLMFPTASSASVHNLTAGDAAALRRVAAGNCPAVR